MFFHRRRLLENALQAVAMARQRLDRSIEMMKTDGAVVRHALKNGGHPELTFPSDELRMLLSEQLAFLMIGTENLMHALGRKHLFEIRPIYPPLDPEDSEKVIARIWAKIWPDHNYPRIHQLTPEERYYAFGPGGLPKPE